MRRVAERWGLAVVLAACAGSVTEADADAVSGRYRLEAVDGVPLPTPLDASTACPVSVIDGDASLTPRVRSRNPSYTVQVFTAPRCEPPVSPRRGAELLRDFGPWLGVGDGGSEVRLQSENGFGTYSGQIMRAPEGGAGPLLTVRLAGRAFTFRRVAPPAF